MSGGHFDYVQHRLDTVLEEIDRLIKFNNDESVDEWGGRSGRGYSAETIEKFEFAKNSIRAAQIYMQRIDWLVSCDDSEESFHKRLQEDFSHE